MWPIRCYLSALLLQLGVAAEAQSFRVLGVGLDRTGTRGLKGALSRLGYSALHFDDLSSDVELREAFGTFAQASEAEGALKKLTTAVAARGYDAAVGPPLGLLYEQLLQGDSSTKVVLTLRSKAEGPSAAANWARSHVATVARLAKPFSAPPLSWLWRGGADVFRWGNKAMALQVDPGTLLPSAQDAESAYEAWRAKVVATVPRERLLILEAGAGWGPLCEFLGVAIPDEAFPAVQESEEAFSKMLKMLEYIHSNGAVIIGVPIVVSLVLLIGGLYFALFYTPEESEDGAASPKKEKKKDK